jgi:t-SNARE complex subunit (syntaxin)
MDVMDAVLTRGIYNTPEFGKGQQEFLFGYISARNHGEFCATMHYKQAKLLNVEKLDQSILDLADLLFDNIAAVVEKTLLVEQILYTISMAKFMNTQVIAHNVQDISK